MTQTERQRQRAKTAKTVGDVIRAITFLLAVVAVVKELRTPAEQRTWHGTVAWRVPYDFRRPTMARVRQRLWSPQEPLVQPRVFGVGWTVNVGRLVAAVQRRAG